jgi:hypothetical protein
MRSRRARTAAAVAGAVALAGLSVAGITWAAPPTGASDRPELPVAAPLDPTDADIHAAVVASEDRRLTEVRTITSLARWQGQNWKTPYRLGTASGYTLVLTPRSAPYTVEDLLRLAPQTFLPMSDGSYLLNEHIVVTPRASLRLTAPGGLTLRLASNADGFATVVSLGGKLELIGEENAKLRITSWDPTTGAADVVTADGRSYVRAIGGQFEANHVELERLGFWAGRTGGLALTGTDRPNTGAIESAGPGDEPDASSLLDDVTWQPAGPLETGTGNPSLDYAVPATDFVSGRIADVAVSNDAFGLFVSGANGVQVTDSSFTGNDLGGVVFHRYVTNGVISRTTSARNVGDGFSIDRATTGIAITESTARENSGNGFTLDGRALADGPSAVGAPLRSYGNNSVTGSTALDNGRYGVELLGGANLTVTNNVTEGHDMGIVVDGPASRVSLTGNTVRDSKRHGIALVDDVTDATVTGNVVDGSSTGVYVRDSTGDIRGNTVQDADAHGVSLVGKVDGSEVAFNVLAGRGASALDTHRSSGDVASETNNLAGWDDTTPWWVLWRKLLRPMNALWSALAVLITVSAIQGRRSRGEINHPYAHQLAHQGHLPMPLPEAAASSQGQLTADAVVSLLTINPTPAAPPPPSALLRSTPPGLPLDRPRSTDHVDVD